MRKKRLISWASWLEWRPNTKTLKLMQNMNSQALETMLKIRYSSLLWIELGFLEHEILTLEWTLLLLELGRKTCFENSTRRHSRRSLETVSIGELICITKNDPFNNCVLMSRLYRNTHLQRKRERNCLRSWSKEIKRMPKKLSIRWKSWWNYR